MIAGTVTYFSQVAKLLLSERTGWSRTNEVWLVIDHPVCAFGPATPLTRRGLSRLRIRHVLFFGGWSTLLCARVSLQRLQLAKHRRDQFCDSRMNVHSSLDYGIRGFGIHHVQNRMNHLIALNP